VIDDAEHLLYLQDARAEGVWPGLRSSAKLEATRQVHGQVSRQTRYYILSWADTARQVAAAIRKYWGVENGLHWVLDIAFREDESRVRQGEGAETLSVLRRMAPNLLKREPTAKVGVHAKRLKAAWDERYLLKVLSPESAE